MQEESMLKIYSMGIVLKDNKEGGDYIEVSPIEHLNISEGLIKDKKTEVKTKIKDNSNIIRDSKSTTTEKVLAKWITFEANRLGAPCVSEGETVVLFKFADSPDIYWTTIFREPLLRRNEYYIIGCSNLKQKGKEFDKETSYWFEINTINKKIQLHTSKNDGEAVGYDLIIDTSNSIFELKDTVGNLVNLNSLDKYLNIETGTINLKASNKIVLDTPNLEISDEIHAKGHMLIDKGIDSPSNINAPNIN